MQNVRSLHRWLDYYCQFQGLSLAKREWPQNCWMNSQGLEKIFVHKNGNLKKISSPDIGNDDIYRLFHFCRKRPRGPKHSRELDKECNRPRIWKPQKILGSATEDSEGYLATKKFSFRLQRICLKAHTTVSWGRSEWNCRQLSVGAISCFSTSSSKAIDFRKWMKYSDCVDQSHCAHVNDFVIGSERIVDTVPSSILRWYNKIAKTHTWLGNLVRAWILTYIQYGS